MPMTPDEYAAKELIVPGFMKEEPLYAPGSNPSEFDPNILLVMNGGVPQPEPTPEPEVDPLTTEMAFEYNFTLPLEQRRAEVAVEDAKYLHLMARAHFWDALTALITKRDK